MGSVAMILLAAVATADVLCIGTPAVAVRSGNPDCRANSATIVPAETSRPLVYFKPDERTILIGELSAGARTFAPAYEDQIRQPFSVVAAETIAARCKLVVG